MKSNGVAGSLSIDLEKMASVVNSLLPFVVIFFGFLGYAFNFNFHFLTVSFLIITLINFYYRHVQKRHTLLANFGIIAQMRYMIESVGPEFRQYLFLNDTEEKPFSRVERNEIYRKAKGVDSSSAFGSQLAFDKSEIKLRHSMFPIPKDQLKPYSLTFGEELSLIHI